MKCPTLSICLTLTALALLSVQTPSLADTKRLAVHLNLSTESFDECDVSTRYKKYELFLSSTPAIPSTLLIRQFECSNDVEPGVAESGSSGSNDLADFVLSDGTIESATGTVTVVDSSGTFTVYNQVGTPRNVSFDLRWTGSVPLQRTSTVMRVDLLGARHVLLDAKFSSAAARVTGVIDGWLLDNCCHMISTVP